MSRDFRLPLLVAVLLGAALLYQFGRTPRADLPVLSPAEHLKEAERIHAAISATEGAPPPDLISAALEHYALAFTASDIRLSSAAHYGRGQIYMLSGDTPAALADWGRVWALNPGDFERLRALKSMADAERASGMATEARSHDRRIVEEFGDSELTQAMRAIVEAARQSGDSSLHLSETNEVNCPPNSL